jgi:hypothetical protein
LRADYKTLRQEDEELAFSEPGILHIFAAHKKAGLDNEAAVSGAVIMRA